MKVYMEQRGATGATEHNKFYEIEDDGKRVIFRWGSITEYETVKGLYENEKRVKVAIESDDAAARQAVFDKQLKSKSKRKDNPYQVISRSGDGGGQEVVESRPSSQGRKWGLEVETHSNLSIQEIAQKMRDRGLEVNVDTGRYFHSEGRVWDVKRDGSCGYEFASPILSGDAGLFDAKLAVEKIREVCETATNSSCGIHVTIDVSDHSNEDLKRLAIAYLKAQEFFYAQCNDSRQDNRYCKRNPTENMQRMIGHASTDVNSILGWCGGWRDHDDRYHGLNWTRVFSRKVIEFRMMESSVKIRSVGQWIRLCVGFVDGVKAEGTTYKTTKTFTKESFHKLIGFELTKEKEPVTAG